MAGQVERRTRLDKIDARLEELCRKLDLLAAAVDGLRAAAEARAWEEVAETATEEPALDPNLAQRMGELLKRYGTASLEHSSGRREIATAGLVCALKAAGRSAETDPDPPPSSADELAEEFVEDYDPPSEDLNAELRSALEEEDELLPPQEELMWEVWTRRLSLYRQNRMWQPGWGAMPGQAGCLAPPQLLEESGFQPGA